MTEPYINIDLDKIEHNTRTIVGFCAKYGIEVSGVSKVVCGNPNVAKAMLRGGVTAIGESRMRNVQRLKANGIHAPFLLLRIPPLSDIEEIVASVNMSLNSELSVIAALSESAVKRGLVHQIILMLDLGDLREGILPDDLFAVTRDVIELEGVKIVGLGTNLSCYGGVVPSEENMGLLAHYAQELEGRFNLKLRWVSGGNSSSLDLIASGKMPQKINHLRLGESILLGRETICRAPIPGTYQDAFLLNSEIIELKQKPSMPIGEIAEDAFGHTPVFEDRGDIIRAILNIGREDTDIDGISPIDTKLSILGASSDHLLLDVTNAQKDMQLGDRLDFSVNYAALLAAMTSQYVEKRCLKHGDRPLDSKAVAFIDLPLMEMDSEFSERIHSKLMRGFHKMGICATNKRDIEIPLSLNDKKIKKICTSLSIQQSAAIDRATSLAKGIVSAYQDCCVPVVISPEPSDALGVYSGLSHIKNCPGLIIFSAYGGFVFPEDENPCDIGRMLPGAFLSYHLEKTIVLDQEKPKFKAENIVLIGVRNLTKAEGQRIKRSMVKVFTMEDIDALGMKEVCYRAARSACMGTSGLHVTFDFSVMDRREIPGILNPSIGGISYREAHLAMEILSQSDLLRSVYITGFTLGKEKNAPIIDSTIGFLLSLFGKRILGGKNIELDKFRNTIL